MTDDGGELSRDDVLSLMRLLSESLPLALTSLYRGNADLTDQASFWSALRECEHIFDLVDLEDGCLDLGPASLSQWIEDEEGRERGPAA